MQNENSSSKHPFRRRTVLATLGAWAAWVLAGCGGGGSGGGDTTAPGPAPESLPWASWRAPVSDLREDVSFLLPPPESLDFRDVTLRQTAHLSLGGEQLRIRLSNLYGKAPVRLVRVRAALAGPVPGAVDAATDVAVTFAGGQEAVTLAPGAQVWSDKVAIRVRDGGDLAVSVYVQEAADAATAHRYANAVHPVAAGDATRLAQWAQPFAGLLSSTHWMDAVDVFTAQPAPRVVVAFGDSITDGNGTTLSANQRYPDLVAARWRNNTAAGGQRVSMVNAGMGGNRWLHDRFGLRGVRRFERDVLGVSGVTHAIVQMGINDIGFALDWTPGEPATLEEIVRSLEGAVAAGKAAGVPVFLATLTPFKGHLYFSTEGEQLRQAVNGWIRSQTVAAGVFDFDAAVRDPQDPQRVAAAYRDPDQLHLNDLGQAQLAEMVAQGSFR